MLTRNLIVVALVLLFSSSSFAQTNVRIGPLHALAGIAKVDVDFAIADSWTLGPTGSYLNRTIDSYDAEAYSLGIRANYYFNKAVYTQGWYLGPSIEYAKVHLVEHDSTVGDLEGTGSGLFLSLLGGYQWMWENFNINLGAGPAYYSTGTVNVKSGDGSINDQYSGYDGLQLAIEFTLGWKF